VWEGDSVSQAGQSEMCAAAVRSEWWDGLEFYFQTSDSLLKLQDVQCE